jgi:hypothetical protein
MSIAIEHDPQSMVAVETLAGNGGTGTNMGLSDIIEDVLYDEPLKRTLLNYSDIDEASGNATDPSQ